MLRKVLLTGILVVAYNGSPPQLAGSILTVFLFLVLHLQVSPYLNKGLNEFQRLILISQFFTIFGGLMFIMMGCMDDMLEREDNAASRLERDIVALFILAINAFAAFLFPVYRAVLFVSNSKEHFTTLFNSGLNKIWSMCCGCLHDKTKERDKATKKTIDHLLTQASSLKIASSNSTSRSLMLEKKQSGLNMRNKPTHPDTVSLPQAHAASAASSGNDFCGITADIPVGVATEIMPLTEIVGAAKSSVTDDFMFSTDTDKDSKKDRRKTSSEKQKARIPDFLGPDLVSLKPDLVSEREQARMRGSSVFEDSDLPIFDLMRPDVVSLEADLVSFDTEGERDNKRESERAKTEKRGASRSACIGRVGRNNSLPTAMPQPVASRANLVSSDREGERAMKRESKRAQKEKRKASERAGVGGVERGMMQPLTGLSQTTSLLVAMPQLVASSSDLMSKDTNEVRDSKRGSELEQIDRRTASKRGEGVVKGDIMQPLTGFSRVTSLPTAMLNRLETASRRGSERAQIESQKALDRDEGGLEGGMVQPRSLTGFSRMTSLPTAMLQPVAPRSDLMVRDNEDARANPLPRASERAQQEKRRVREGGVEVEGGGAEKEREIEHERKRKIERHRARVREKERV